MVFILGLFLCPHADALFSTDFEEPNPFAKWEIVSPSPVQDWAIVSDEYAASGAKGIRIASGDRYILTKRVLLSLNSPELKAGLYYSFDFKINKSDITADTSANIWCTLLSFVMSGNQSVLYGNPALLLEKKGPDVFVKMLMRQKHGDNPLTIPPNPMVCVVPGMWHSISVFISIRDSVLIDSLLYDNRFIGAGTRKLIGMPAMIEKVELGAEQAKRTPVSFICFDNISVSERRPASVKLMNQITISQRLNKTLFHIGDTLFLDMAFAPFGRKDYLDLNVRSSSFDTSKEDRFGVFNRKRNMVFSLYNSIRVPFKGDEGLNAWRGASAGDTSAQNTYPYTTFLFKKYRFYPDRGVGTVALRITGDLEPGAWEIHGCIVRTSDSVAVQNLAPLHFTIARKFPLIVLVGCGAALLIVFGIIFMRMTGRSKEKGPLQGNINEIADKIDVFLATAYTSSILSNEDIAKAVYLSRSHATALYRRARGISPMQRLRDIRMEKACEMLDKTDKTISDIGFAVGFNDQNIFLRNFKKYNKLSPTEYQKQKKTV
ncbi:MAG: hypothetical protein A2268_09025 [Candidatus Raymondbacteria bacterium RifOxyA12_full_50_37]|uniref:HTH araC/xylS-type domain-containing protein n=1 Tax=Candidatus Raymondbacteria bacterium RIFOXYD12_FULL_49_13 TaxID=1817890 RepID=A0A1F7F0Q8_UNCRA|nr:MAG: hypothetical protein A2268_09025 [Candidatus Raymondbacteria bacterium RifOxyA12_full_50_37]OGJ86890.1 MAG: hypothetical protein A2248_08230 [Candidatus Raymondbacteria bacterium RIFOXYA2_FULL_49_16]OGJ94796.1 MAG: hypothetical protein A2350_20745 [Candidatus Raymondbacteria bacterium RifOxyB12_full_50_8]OGK00240.1 MAG: hypothetical protein A2519_07140 [Candidatus Raymondbacteria bacterium RIFOXYD12_FULL_49_13]OGP41109.1 MAG: hypothetical protein A2324_07395 [Candidatus Raymondbacteria 